jgi:choline dehydrogenase
LSREKPAWLSSAVQFDVLVLGGGAAGCVLAGRLSENRDRSVCLVEAGPDYGHLSEGRWPADILDRTASSRRACGARPRRSRRK